MSTLSPEKQLNELFNNAFNDAYPDAAELTTNIKITPSTKPDFGHYQCNAAMALGKQLKRPPREIAQSILEHLQSYRDSEAESIIERTEIAGPGFINIHLSSRALAQCCKAQLTTKQLGINLPVKPEHILIDYSSPNVAKEMHVGHLRSTVIGDALANLFTFLGHDVKRINHIGDWGTAFGMLIAYLKAHHPQVVSGEITPPLSDLVVWYKAAKKQFDEDPAFKKTSQEHVVALQAGDQTCMAIWKQLCHISSTAYQAIYDLLDVKLEERGESFYNPWLAETISDLKHKNLIECSDGAWCMFLDGYTNRDGDPLPLMVQKSDGGYNYASTDLTALRYRIETEQVDRILYVTDAGQSMHFQMVFEAGRRAGYLTNDVLVSHVPFGLVLGPDGKKFKTRSGEVEKLIDLLNHAIEKATIIFQERNPDWSKDDIKHAAHVLGLNAVKYADLSSNREQDYMYNEDKMLSFEGNTAAFLMYSHVRMQSIIRKTNKNPMDYIQTQDIVLEHPTEIACALHLSRFETSLKQCSHDLMPHKVADYLYQCANHFNAFFRDCRVEGDQHEISRLLLVELCQRIMAQGLTILGLKTLSKM